LDQSDQLFGTKFYFIVPFSKSRKHEIPVSHAGQFPRRSEWWENENEETNRRGGEPLGNEQGPAEKGDRQRMH
jgi:hypothetical protein